MTNPKTIGNAMAVAEATPCQRHLRLPAAKTSRCLDSLSKAPTMSDVVPSSSKMLARLTFYLQRYQGPLGVSNKPKRKLGSRFSNSLCSSPPFSVFFPLPPFRVYRISLSAPELKQQQRSNPRAGMQQLLCGRSSSPWQLPPKAAREVQNKRKKEASSDDDEDEDVEDDEDGTDEVDDDDYDE